MIKKGDNVVTIVRTFVEGQVDINTRLDFETSSETEVKLGPEVRHETPEHVRILEYRKPSTLRNAEGEQTISPK